MTTATIIKATTKKGQAMLDKALHNEGYYLHDVYGSVSHAKKDAWEHCLAQCSAEGGHNFHIISHNSFNFSVAWEIPEGVRIETASNSYFIPLNN